MTGKEKKNKVNVRATDRSGQEYSGATRWLSGPVFQNSSCRHTSKTADARDLTQICREYLPKFFLQLLFNISLAFRAIRTNLLRSVLTILIIGVGIMALVGILTGIEVIKKAVVSNFSDLGANSFQITGDVLKKKKSKGGGMNISITEGKDIKWEEAKAFKERYFIPAQVGISVSGTGTATIAWADRKTNPNIETMGVDEAYFTIANTAMSAGRTFSPYELQYGSYVCILGHSVATKLFKGKWADAVGKTVSAGAAKFRVIGIAAEKGGSMMMNADNLFFMPVNTARALYGGSRNYVLSVQVTDIHKKPVATDEAEGLFRMIRKQPLGVPNNFSINQNDNLASIVLEDTKKITTTAIIIAIITLLNSAIGLMNIMLVSVSERTREIGVSKALGARPSAIRGQFFTESVVISLLGGILGIVLGLLLGNLVGIIFKTGFIVPWAWVIMGVVLCAAVGIISGIYPALKASKLDPIEALRYE